ncbi:hypothetical protein MMC19_007044 [Ptychographa xylographoides]|nr:hypothetical protein [Ptychographa xylographoides]
MPTSPSKSVSSSHVASNQYIEQHRAFVEHQRELHNEERALWHLERQDLHIKIKELESTIRKLRGTSNEGFSPQETPVFALGAFGSLSNHRGSRTTSTSTGDEFWRGAGGKSGSIPTRTFSESSEYSVTRSEDIRMPSIAENDAADASGSRLSVISRETSREKDDRHHRPSIDGAKIDKNLDGISFKPGGLAPSVVKSVITPQSPSPLQSPNSAQHSPKLLDLPARSRLTAEALYTKDAGHTPLARMGASHLDGMSSNASDQNTPKIAEQETVPFEPRPSVSVSRPPNERAESYFPTSESQAPPVPEEAIDEDPALKGPLGLKNEKSEDSSFLNELDSKLLQAARSHVFSPNSEKSRGTVGHNSASKENDDPGDGGEKEFDQPETEPKLRIKRSMNFGSVFGAKTCGKGFEH